MTAVAQGPPATVTVSLELWRLWFDRGLKAIDDKEFQIAIHWLREAMRHACAGGPEDRRHAITQGHLAYAYLQLAHQSCREIVELCLDDCKIGKLEKLAKQALEEASVEARCASPRLTITDSDPQNNLATARCFHVLGEVCRLADEFAAARERYAYARRGYSLIPSQAESLAEVAVRLFEIDYQLGDFTKALIDSNELEQYVAGRNDSAWLAQVVAGRADTLVQVGRYREAGQLYPRWKALIGVSIDDLKATYENAFALAAFGRVKLILGDFEESEMLLHGSCRLLECLPARQDWLRACLTCRYSCCPYRDDSLRFDVPFLQAELALARGDLVCARQLLNCLSQPTWLDRQIRLCLARGKLQLALGCFRDACICFSEARRLAESMTHCRAVLFIPALLGMSRSDSETSNWVTAITMASQAIECLEQRHETVSAEFAWSLHELAVAYIRDDRSREAGPLGDRAISLFGMTLRPEHPDEAVVLLTQAEFWISRRQPDKALEAISRAGTLFRMAQYRDGFTFARMLRLEGEAHQADHHPVCAMHCFLCANRCWVEQAERLHCEHPEQSLILLGLAVVNVSQGACHEADMSFAVFRDMLIRLKGNAARAGFELNRRGNLFQMLCLYDEADWLYCRAEQLYCDCYGSNHAFTQQVRANRMIVKQRREDAIKCPWLCHCGHPGCPGGRHCNYCH